MTGLELVALSQGAASGIQAGVGLYQMIKSQRQLNALKRQRMPSVMDAAAPYQENIKLARRQYEQGLDPATRRMISEQAATAQAGVFRSAGEMGQAGQSLSRLAGFNAYQGALQMGSMDVAARQRGMSALTSANLQYGNLLREDARARRQYRMSLEQQLGYAKSEGRQNIMGSVSGLAKTGVTVGSMYGGNELGGDIAINPYASYYQK